MFQILQTKHIVLQIYHKQALYISQHVANLDDVADNDAVMNYSAANLWSDFFVTWSTLYMSKIILKTVHICNHTKHADNWPDETDNDTDSKYIKDTGVNILPFLLCVLWQFLFF